jgi:hypothetical protein
MLERIEFVNALAENRSGDFAWNSLGLLDAGDIDTPEGVVDFFDEILFQGTLPEANRNLLLEYLTTDEGGQPRALERADEEDFRHRVEELVGLMLSLPQWNFQ